MNNRLIALYVSFFLFSNILFSQPASNVQLVKETEGLIITTILADHRGQIWIGTNNNGLMIYNGYEVKKNNFDPNDSTSIKGNTILGLFEDKNNTIWISSLEGDLIRHDPISQTNKKYPFKAVIGKNDKTEFLCIRDIRIISGKIYFTASYDSPLSKSILTYDYSKDKIIPFAINSKHPDYSYFFMPDSKGNALIFGQDAQLYELSTSKDTITKLPFSELQDLANQSFSSDGKFDDQNRFWIISPKGDLYRFDNIYTAPSKVYSFRHLIPSGVKNIAAAAIEFDHDQNIWLGTNHGLFHFNQKSESFKKIEMPLDFNDKVYKILRLYVDKFNNLWIGTQTGLLKYENKPIFYDYLSQTADTSNHINDDGVGMIQSKGAKIGFVSFKINEDKANITLHILDPASNKLNNFVMTEILPAGANITGISEVGKDTFIIGSDRGVYRLESNSKKISKINLPGIPATHPGISNYYQDKYGNEWLGSTNYIYKKLIGDEKYSPIDLSTQPGGSTQSNMAIVEDAKKHGLWLISQNGLFLYDYTTRKTNRLGFNSDQSKNFMTQDISAIYTEDSSDIAWVGIRSGGLNKLDIATGKVKKYTTMDGLPHMSVYTLLFDKKNEALWLGTANGISRFNVKTEKFTNFSAADGIRGKEFYSGILSNDGHMYFAGNGLIRFKPEDINAESLPPIVSITDFKVSNKSIAHTIDSFTPHTLITLKHNQNYISIDFLGIHYSDPKNNKYSYKLEGFDAEWNHVINQHTAYYTNLPVGEYTFKIKAANSNGMWNEQGASLKIKILPPWWRTNLAFLFYLLGAIALVKLGNSGYKNYVLKQERSLTQAKEIAQAKEIEKAYKELEQSHKILQSTQAQLVQSEKMASLGELTAGIAHEIQNPLNFVNNFSEVNKELLGELKDEIKRGNLEEVSAIADDVINNSEKINHHGKRAESIVKGMLEHSRKSTGVKESTDINKLCDEFVRLSYHARLNDGVGQGLRAKDKDFNCDYKLDLDPNLPLVNVVSQDIGRVLLNIINNAFQACSEKSESLKLESQNDYMPLVTLTTKFSASMRPRLNGEVGQVCEIIITDNGPGIPESIKDKIFQPFFTTKPTGQGTGLGLSLAYDIMKAHGGSIEVKSNYSSQSGPPEGVPIAPDSYRDGIKVVNNENVGTEFIIQIPIQ